MTTDRRVDQPITGDERLHSLDLLRGVALLGILLLNIQAFAMPGAAYLNPTAYGNLTGANLWVWLLTYVFGDQKFMSLFSMLFGAGVCIFTERAEQTHGRSAALHYRRSVWLLLFGLAHAHLLWAGDILYSYALCAMLVYLFRHARPRTLLFSAALFLLVPTLYNLMMQMAIPQLPAEAIAGMQRGWAPDARRLMAEVQGYQGGWLEQQPFRHRAAVMLETLVFATLFFWRATGMMLIGMALYKLGVLGLKRSDLHYQRYVLFGLLVGVQLSMCGVLYNFGVGWELRKSMFGGSIFNYWGSIATSLAYLGAVMLWARHGGWTWLQRRLEAVGRTAFSNYILQSLLCTFVFYGHGLGWFGDTPRWQQMLVVLAVWIVQLVISPLWLQRFRFGPLEWLWRSLTYGRMQPMRRSG